MGPTILKGGAVIYGQPYSILGIDRTTIYTTTRTRHHEVRNYGWH